MDDNSFMLLKTAKHQEVFLHVSCTEWKNPFPEVYGRNAKLKFPDRWELWLERLTYYKRCHRPEAGKRAWEYPMTDDSWAFELTEFYEDIGLNREPSSGLKDAYAALKVIEQIYKESGL